MGRSPWRLALLLIPLALTCFALSPSVQALNPPPDGGYPQRNTAEGDNSLDNVSVGHDNTAIGYSSLDKNTTGSFNVALGAGAGNGVITANDVICIGRGVAGANVSNTCFIGNIRGVTTQNGNALPVVIDGAGQLGTMSSSKRFKKEIKPMENASDSLLRLKPVTFHYKSDGTNRPEFGLIAEDVAKVNPDLVVPDDSGDDAFGIGPVREQHGGCAYSEAAQQAMLQPKSKEEFRRGENTIAGADPDLAKCLAD